MSAKLATHWSPLGTMQRIVCLTPRAVELASVDGTVVLVEDVLFGLGVADTVGAEEVVKTLKLPSVVLWLLGLSVTVFIVPGEMPALSVAVFVLAETTKLAEELEPKSLTVMDAVTVSVTVTAGHVLSVAWAVVKAASREKIKAVMRRDIVHLDIILAAITND